MSIQSVFLDFDGTLVDSSKGIFSAFSRACHSVNATIPEIDHFRQLIGPPIRAMAQHLFPDMSTGRLEELVQTFRQEYDHSEYALVEWHSGVTDAIKEATLNGSMQFCVVTNKPTIPTLAIIEEAHLIDCFKCVVGVDYREVRNSDSAFSDKAEAISYALSLAKTRADETVYIGDTPSDQRSANQCDLLFIAATYGFHAWTKDELAGVLAADCFREAISLVNLLGTVIRSS